MTIFFTPLSSVIESCPRFRLPSGKVVTATPLGDARNGLRARLDRDSAIEALRDLGLVLLTRETVLEIARVGHWVKPVTLVRTAEDQRLMRTEAYCRKHDAEMMRQLDESKWDRETVCSTFGKWHIQGAAPGANRICGWPQSKGGKLIQEGIADVHIGEKLTDYATLTMGEEPSVSTDDPDLGETKMIITRLLKKGLRGVDVSWLQQRVGAKVDGDFGPITHRAVQTKQTELRLVADGVAGERTVRALGGTWRPTQVVSSSNPRSPSPACIAALRDANIAWPNRNKRSDGIMGDLSHQFLTGPDGKLGTADDIPNNSDHNLGLAVDITHDPENGCDCNMLAQMAIADDRVTYVIWNKRIYNRARASEGWRPYTGKNGHTHHIHISVHAAARSDASPWPWAS